MFYSIILGLLGLVNTYDNMRAVSADQLAQMDDYKLSYNAYADQQVVIKGEILGFDSLILEEHLILKVTSHAHVRLDSSQRAKLSKKGDKLSIGSENLVIDKVASEDSLLGYQLSRVDATTTYTFDVLRHFLKQIPVSEKKNGFSFQKNIAGITTIVDHFKLVGDTLVNGERRKLLTCSQRQDSLFTTYKITLDQTLFKKLTIHPISQDLDDKFQGICLSLEALTRVGDEEHTWAVIFDVDKNLSEEDKTLIAYFRNWVEKRK